MVLRSQKVNAKHDSNTKHTGSMISFLPAKERGFGARSHFSSISGIAGVSAGGSASTISFLLMVKVTDPVCSSNFFIT